MTETISHPGPADRSAALIALLRDAASLHRQGRLDEAASRYLAVLAAAPRHFDALHLLGVLRAQQGELTEALSLLGRAVEQNPDSAAAQNNLGMALNLAKRHWQAIAPLERAISLNPQDAVAHNNLGVSLQALGRHKEAMACFEQAAALNPRYVEALSNLGAIYREDGRFAEARRGYERALAAEPNNIDVLSALMQCGPVTADDPHFATLEAASEKAAAVPEDQRIKLHFALGKAYADLGQDERGFRHLVDGNTLKRRRLVYDEAARLASFDRIRTVFSAEFMQSRAGQGNPSERPIFILGMMRSGSTLVEQILASHPDVYAAGERSDFNAAYQAVLPALASSAIYPDTVPLFTDEQLRQLGDNYLERLDELTFGYAAALRITDKMLGNFSAVGLIHLALPNARIIHTVREPVDTCLSCYSKLFVDEQPFAYDLGELGRYYRGYAKLMAHWRAVLPEGAILEVPYEELVADFENQVRRMLDYCGLDWDDACLSFHETDRPVRTASQAQVRQPIYRSSIGRWRPEAEVLRPLIEGLGSDIDSILRGGNARAGKR